jgi:outer membrane protein assembly factor BamB
LKYINAATAQKFSIDFSSQAAADREAKVYEVRQWMNRYFSELSIPQNLQVTNERGRTLIALYSQNKIKELDPLGNEVWSDNVKQPTFCKGLINGHRLVVLSEKHQIVEYDESGKVCWTSPELESDVFGVDRNDLGNTIVAMPEVGKIIELNSVGETIRRWEDQPNVTSVQYIEGDLLLVSYLREKRIAELDRAGQVVWSLSLPQSPSCVRVTANETYLIKFSESGAAEYNRTGQLIRTFNIGPGYGADQLGDGTYLFSDGNGIFRQSSAGEAREPVIRVTDFIHFDAY